MNKRRILKYIDENTSENSFEFDIDYEARMHTGEVVEIAFQTSLKRKAFYIVDTEWFVNTKKNTVIATHLLEKACFV